MNPSSPAVGIAPAQRTTQSAQREDRAPLRDAVETASGSEHRRWERTAYRRTMQIQPLAGGEPERPIATRVADFSAIGLGLIHSRRMSVGEQFVVPLGTLTGEAVPLLYSVIHCRGLKNGLYAIGAELVSVMDLKEFAKVVPEGKTVGEYIKTLL